MNDWKHHPLRVPVGVGLLVLGSLGLVLPVLPGVVLVVAGCALLGIDVSPARLRAMPRWAIAALALLLLAGAGAAWIAVAGAFPRPAP